MFKLKGLNQAFLQYEQSIADMLQKQTLRLDESQEGEFSQLRDRLQYELNILTAYQEKNRLQAQAQRDRERKELEDRVNVRRGLLESKVRARSIRYYLFLIMHNYLRWKLNFNSSTKSVRKEFDCCVKSKKDSWKILMSSLLAWDLGKAFDYIDL